MTSSDRKTFLEGVRDGLPIGMGYFAVAFSLGIVAQAAGLNAWQGFLASYLNVASAGEYALFTSIQAGVSYIEVAVISFVINARYLLMSPALTQRFGPETKFIDRLLVGYGVTGEIFGISIARDGYLNPKYNYGAMAISIPLWSIGTALGIIAGNFLPLRVVSALSVALYGMFLAIIVPAAKKNVTILIAVIVSFAMSYAFGIIPHIKNLSGGNRTIILTVLISSVAALIKPVEDETAPNSPPDGKNKLTASNAINKAEKQSLNQTATPGKENR